MPTAAPTSSLCTKDFPVACRPKTTRPAPECRSRILPHCSRRAREQSLSRAAHAAQGVSSRRRQAATAEAAAARPADLERFGPSLIGAHSHHPFHVEHPYLAVTHHTGAGGSDNGV